MICFIIFCGYSNLPVGLPLSDLEYSFNLMRINLINNMGVRNWGEHRELCSNTALVGCVRKIPIYYVYNN